MQNINLFSGLDKLRIILFWEILKEKNPLLLDANFKPENKYTKEEESFIVNTWERLYDEFFEYKNDSKGRLLLKETEDEMRLLFKINLLVDLRNHLEQLFYNIESIEVKNFEELKFSAFEIIKKIEKKIKLTVFVDIPEAINILDRVLNSLQNSYSIKTKRNNQEIDKQIQNVYSVVAKVESVLERSIPNIDTISVLQWIAYENSAKEKINSQKDLRNGKK